MQAPFALRHPVLSLCQALGSAMGKPGKGTR